MSAAQKILEMIEGVDPNDTDTLDEIDARVWCYYIDRLYIKHEVSNSKQIWIYCASKISPKILNSRFTRSRNELKAIRPIDCAMKLTKYNGGDNGWSECELVSARVGWKWGQGFSSAGCRTEELAELHAIIQAIEWERSQ